MVAKDTDTPKISTSNTKKEILEAFNALKDKLESEAKEALRPQRQKEEKKNKEVTSKADSLATAKVTSAIDTLKIEINAALADITIKMEEEIDRYNKVKGAISVREDELQNIFEIEQSAYTLAALLEAQKQKKEEFEDEIARRREALEEEISQTRISWDKEQADYTANAQEQKDQDKKIRQREQEEYDYKLKREREQKTSALQDEISRLEKELAQKKEAFEQKVTVREAELKERESTVAQEEKRLVSLEVQVDNFSRELEQAVKKTAKETTDRLTAEMAKDEKLLRQTFEGEKNVFSARIQAFEQLASEQKKQIAQLTSQLEKAYGKVQDIAIKAVSSPRERYAAESQSKGRTQNDTQS